MNKKILHIAKDEKFIDNAFWQFQQLDSFENTFLVVLNRNELKPKYVKSSSGVFIKQISDKSFKEIEKLISQYDLVVLYGLDFFISRLVLKVKANYLWMFLGGEVYNNPHGLQSSVFGDKTKKIKLTKDAFSLENSILKPIARKVKFGYASHKKTIMRAAKEVNYFGVIHKEDYQNMCNKVILSPSTKLFKFAFYPIEFIFGLNESLKVNSDNILLGNSSSKTNNHLEIFDILVGLKVGDRKVVTPLSYGDKEYADIVSRKGVEIFKECFRPITTFLTLDEYNKLIQGCGIVIMNHYRQQAMGNIMASLWMGAKVYLDERNTIYPYLKRIGIHVYSISKDLVPSNKNIFELLDESQIIDNRNILKNEVGKENLLNLLSTQLKQMLHE